MAVTDYLRGTGTLTDPYLIHDASAAQMFFGQIEPCFMTSAYFSVIADIDCSSFTLTSTVSVSTSPQWKAKLYGNGHAIINLYFSSGNTLCQHKSSGNGLIEDLYLHIKKCPAAYFVYSSSYRWESLKNCKIISDLGNFHYTTSQLMYAENVITNQITYNNSSPLVSNTTYTVSAEQTSIPQGGVILVGDARYNPANYPTLSTSKWLLNGVNLPSLIPNGRADLTQKYVVKGTTKVGGILKKRNIALFTSAYFGLLKKTQTDDFGAYLIDLVDVSDPIFIVHYDDYGLPLFANTAYALGAYIHPKTPNGYRYKCTTAGTSGAELPSEPWPTSSNLTAGTAIFSPEPVYKTETFLVSPHLYDFLTGQPV